jgi:cytochrome c peroxidase
MKQMQAEFKIVLPLDQDGKVICVTCHNPHQKGLIPDQRAGATGAGAIHRHRLAGNMCIKCHPMR